MPQIFPSISIIIYFFMLASMMMFMSSFHFSSVPSSFTFLNKLSKCQLTKKVTKW